MAANFVKASASLLNVSPKPAAERRIAVLILGMHRSGTSALARMLNLLGCALPHTLMPSGAANIPGHWESDRIRYFNDEILAAAGTTWNDWLPVNPGLAKSPVWPGFIERGRIIVNEEFSSSALFVLKDPRICRLTSFWLEVFAAENIDAPVVIPVRNPLEVARSLKVRDEIDEHYALLIWLRHLLEAEASTRGRCRVFSSYNELLTDWEGLAARIGEGLRLVWPRVSPLSAQEITNFIALDQRHHVAPYHSLKADPAITPWVSETFEILQRWAETGEDRADHARLDIIMSGFNIAALAFARPVFSALQQGERAAQLGHELSAARSSLDAAQTETRDLRSAQENQAAERAAALDLATAERDTVLADLTNAEEQASIVSAELCEARRQLAITENILRQREEEIAQVRIELHAARAEAAELLASGNNAAQEIAQARAESVTLKSIIDETRENWAAAQDQLKDCQLEIDGLLKAHQLEIDDLLNDHQLETDRLHDRDAAATVAEARLKWLREVSASLIEQPHWWILLPRRWKQILRHRSLISLQLFDAKAYLIHYNDVSKCNIDPLQHYIIHGIDEDRATLFHESS